MSVAQAQAGQQPVPRLFAFGAVMALATLLAACQGSQPGARTFYDFKEDSVARDGVLSRCDQAPDSTANDQECVAARRAAAAVALEQQRSRSDGLERQSERKLVAMRDRAARLEQTGEPAAGAPAFGSPIGQVLPSMDKSSSSDPYDVQFPARPSFELGEVEPPSSAIEIVQPTLKPEDVAVHPARLKTTN